MKVRFRRIDDFESLILNHKTHFLDRFGFNELRLSNLRFKAHNRKQQRDPKQNILTKKDKNRDDLKKNENVFTFYITGKDIQDENSRFLKFHPIIELKILIQKILFLARIRRYLTLVLS